MVRSWSEVGCLPCSAFLVEGDWDGSFMASELPHGSTQSSCWASSVVVSDISLRSKLACCLSFEQMLSAFLRLHGSLNAVPRLVVAPSPNLFLLFLHDCSFATVIHHDINLCFLTVVGDPCSRGGDPQVEATALEAYPSESTHGYGSRCFFCSKFFSLVFMTWWQTFL